MDTDSKVRAGFGDDPLLSFEYLNPEGRRLLRDRFLASAPSEKLDIVWDDVAYSRIALVNRLAWQQPSGRYLEIGCEGNLLFHAVPLADKVGVDPLKGGTHRMSSDEFFAENQSRFDIIFIDGLHTYEQVRRDVINAMAALAPGGWIALHDLVPRTWEEEHVPRVSGLWTGDVWKVAIELSKTPTIEFRILMIDHGVGLMRLKDDSLPELTDLREDLAEAGFARFFEEFEALPKNTWDEAMAWIDAAGADQTKGHAQ